ncbi:hypothetical protein WJX81_006775 [Elliptochloris bilobata]|uniref:Uncharacterized protein n=1 Tax=Elliptochloris bilobata TaxID=381761 RepID=A0AAW1RD11_9CHLO
MGVGAVCICASAASTLAGAHKMELAPAPRADAVEVVPSYGPATLMLHQLIDFGDDIVDDTFSDAGGSDVGEANVAVENLSDEPASEASEPDQALPPAAHGMFRRASPELRSPGSESAHAISVYRPASKVASEKEARADDDAAKQQAGRPTTLSVVVRAGADVEVSWMDRVAAWQLSAAAEAAWTAIRTVPQRSGGKAPGMARAQGARGAFPTRGMQYYSDPGTHPDPWPAPRLSPDWLEER